MKAIWKTLIGLGNARPSAIPATPPLRFYVIRTREGESLVGLSAEDLGKLYIEASADHDHKELKQRLNMAGCLSGWRCLWDRDGFAETILYDERILLSAREVTEIRQHAHAVSDAGLAA